MAKSKRKKAMFKRYQELTVWTLETEHTLHREALRLEKQRKPELYTR